MSTIASQECSVRIYLRIVPGSLEKGTVRLFVFVKGSRQIANNLMGFLSNQNIQCTRIPQGEKKDLSEFIYFEDGFSIVLDPKRWSFYDLRSFIQSYADMCEEDFIIKDNLSTGEEKSLMGKEPVMDDQFFLKITKEVEKCFDRYYEQNMSISLFLSGLLKFMRQNLQLYWVAATIKDFQKKSSGYLNYEPTTLSHVEIARSCNRISDGIKSKSVSFLGESLADFFLKTGPFSPQEESIDGFFNHMTMHIAGFLYGHLMHKRETIKLKSEIAELRRVSKGEEQIEIIKEKSTPKTIRLVVLGDSLLNNSQINSEFIRVGIDTRNVEIHTDHNKYHSFDTNNLLAIRSRFDGILLGPMPHKMKGDFDRADNLLVQMERNATQYPPFVVIRDKRGDLKITKGSLRKAIEELLERIYRVGNYFQ